MRFHPQAGSADKLRIEPLRVNTQKKEAAVTNGGSRSAPTVAGGVVGGAGKERALSLFVPANAD